ncbi:hypothetical protein LLT1_02845 [Lactococcus cremoris subsp. cremoris TIFN1]|uniref:Uncharacterized protein n=2 Tax=Lactococcus cremoris subsp. cremoris TaxID=2816960 RepID=T0S8B0_LACLC|nr:hypothetical protein LLT6_04840 [Lactococcus cremoris subsp. cremoris TIFN6]EQC86301.1 hypothetical protein LLT1_02845 [Lactococcus cremoris subsp. cremoris TIFN1]EQC94026.1 hypothetical protein LLT3_03985 [Lactococcus cremoris subsp. cremoris TIFN3]
MIKFLRKLIFFLLEKYHEMPEKRIGVQKEIVNE